VSSTPPLEIAVQKIAADSVLTCFGNGGCLMLDTQVQTLVVLLEVVNAILLNI
jgi:hypothetical protein